MRYEFLNFNFVKPALLRLAKLTFDRKSGYRPLTYNNYIVRQKQFDEFRIDNDLISGPKLCKIIGLSIRGHCLNKLASIYDQKVKVRGNLTSTLKLENKSFY